MELRALFLLTLCFPGLQGQAPEVQRRREGDTLYFECPYTAESEYQATKYWCRQINGGCQEIVRAYYESTVQSRDGRIKIKDDPTSRTVSITMADLRAEDSGTYFCAVYKSYTYLQLRTISLNVFQELLRWELDTLAVQCPRRSGVAWCRAGQADCAMQGHRKSASPQGERKSLQERASIKQNAQGTLTVTMEKLQSQDSGVYWCAQGPERTRITEVVLSVFKRTQQLSAEESGNVTVQCHYKVADYGAVSKAWCKKEEGERCEVLASTSPEPPPEGPSRAREGVRMQDDGQQGTVTVTMEQLQEQDSGVYWCALREPWGLARIQEVTLSVSRAGGSPGSESRNQEILLDDSPEASSSENPFIVLSVVLLLLLLLALLTSVALAVRHYQLLGRAGNRGAEDTRDRAEGTAQPGSPGRRESSRDDSKGSDYINLDVQSQPSPEDPLYCNVEPSQAPRNPQRVEYAVIAFSQAPRNGRE